MHSLCFQESAHNSICQAMATIRYVHNCRWTALQGADLGSKTVLLDLLRPECGSTTFQPRLCCMHNNACICICECFWAVSAPRNFIKSKSTLQGQAIETTIPAKSCQARANLSPRAHPLRDTSEHSILCWRVDLTERIRGKTKSNTCRLIICKWSIFNHMRWTIDRHRLHIARHPRAANRFSRFRACGARLHCHRHHFWNMFE
mmetsp:Transcript_117285/g.184477  ORF Transcript_117285/g.184477 Transcript_117285/m.184477 type:complete len:203 (-) Transcript_117285:310-918(-)